MTLLVYEEEGLRVDLVSDGVYRMDAGAMFGVVPKVLWSRHIEADSLNRVPLALNCLLVRDDETTVLVDTGFGTKLDERALEIYGLDAERRSLIDDLAALDVGPEDVDIVVNTHLHWDHCGGNTRFDESGVTVPTFPNATYVVQRIEWSEAMYPDDRTRATYVRENFEPLSTAGCLELVDADVRVTEHVSTVITRGHTRAHQSVLVEPNEAAPILFLADLAPRAVHLERVPWVPAVDVLPLESLQTKRSTARWLVENEALAVLQHDTDTPVGRLHDGERHFRFEPVGERP